MGDSQPPPPPPSTSAGGDGVGPKRANVVPWVAAALVVAVVAALATFLLSGGSKAHTLTGTVALVAPGSITGDSTTCKGTNDFAEFGPGMVVTVSDGNGDVIGKGKTTNQSKNDAADGGAGTRCEIDFRVGVDDASNYRIEVGKLATHTVDRSDLEADDWHVVLNLG